MLISKLTVRYFVNLFTDDHICCAIWGVNKLLKKKTEVIAVAICSVLLVVLLIINFAVGTFFRYYSMVAVSEEEDYSDVLVSLSDEDTPAPSDINIELPEDSVFYNKDILNILLIGTDERSKNFYKAARADSIMLMSLNKNTFDVKLVSFERDTYVAIPKVPKRNPDKLGHTFQYGGAKLLMETLQTHFSLDVEKYVRVNFNVFEKLIDEIGGVDIVLTKQEANLIINRFNIVVKEGTNHLDGATALFYSRIRYIDSDWQRVKRQQNVIIAIKNSFRKKSVGELKAIVDECLPYVQTNLSAYECAYLLLNIAEFTKGEVAQRTIPDWKTFSNLEHVNFKSNAKILREFLNGE